jgi:hypothetical protein
MATYTVAALPRVLALMPLAALATVAAALAVGPSSSESALRPVAAMPAPVEQPLVIPDVRGQAHVFAKGVLEESGFGWKVRGRVRGYSANVVVRQVPEPGTRVYDTGMPMIVLELARSGAGAEHGNPENRSSYGGTRIRLFDAPSVPFASPDRPEGRL